MAVVFEQFAIELAAIAEEDSARLPQECTSPSLPLQDVLSIVTTTTLANDAFDAVSDPERISAAAAAGQLVRIARSWT